jgi:hypothetical protein
VAIFVRVACSIGPKEKFVRAVHDAWTDSRSPLCPLDDRSEGTSQAILSIRSSRHVLQPKQSMDKNRQRESLTTNICSRSKLPCIDLNPSNCERAVGPRRRPRTILEPWTIASGSSVLE